MSAARTSGSGSEPEAGLVPHKPVSELDEAGQVPSTVRDRIYGRDHLGASAEAAELDHRPKDRLRERLLGDHAELLHHAQDVQLLPDLDGLTVDHADDLDLMRADRPAGRRDAEVVPVLPSARPEPDRDEVVLGAHL